MDKSKNKLLVGLGLSTIIILGIIYSRFHSVIYGVFPEPQSESETSSTEKAKQELKTQDTDGDGISDYEERVSYETSQYLADSDGDGFSDKEEIEANSDPMNPRSTPENKTVKADETIEKKVIKGEKKENGEENQEMSVEEIRNLLIDQGLSKQVVDNFDDKTLKSLYNETKEELDINNLKQIQNK